MAGEWIKMRPTLVLDSPKVGKIVKFLSKQAEFWKWLTGDEEHHGRVTRVALRYVTVSALLRVWGAANMHTTDGSFVAQDAEDIDDMAGIPGFGRAMEFAGWLTVAESGVDFPNFLEHNHPESLRHSAAKSDAQRAREYRLRKKRAEESAPGDDSERVTNRHARHGREEKRREEKNNTTITPTPSSNSRHVPHAARHTRAAGAAVSEGGQESSIPSPPIASPPIPAELDGADFRPVWQEWLAYRRERGLTLCRPTLTKQLKMLAALGRSGAIESIEQAIRCGWSGVFPPGGNGKPAPKTLKPFVEAMREAGIEPAADTSLPDSQFARGKSI